MSRFWKAQPLHTSIIEILLKKKGALTDTQLYKTLEKTNRDLSFRELNRNLMKLEIEGLIHVSNLTKNKRRIELRQSRDET